MFYIYFFQIQRLSITWHILRQNFTDSAFNFEAKLRPTLKNMNECTNPQAPNTTIPHLLPYMLLMDRTTDDMIGIFYFYVIVEDIVLMILKQSVILISKFGLLLLFLIVVSMTISRYNFISPLLSFSICT